MEHAVERGRVERPVDGERLADVVLDDRDVQALQPPGCMTEDVHVGVEESHRAAVRHSGSCQEVTGTRTHVEVPAADVPPVTLHKASRRAPPHDRREEAEDQGVVDLEEERCVLTLALVAGVVTVHGAQALLGRDCSPSLTGASLNSQLLVSPLVAVTPGGACVPPRDLLVGRGGRCACRVRRWPCTRSCWRYWFF